VVFQFFEIGEVAKGPGDLLAQFIHVGFADEQVFARTHLISTNFLGIAGGILEVSANSFLRLLTGIEEPEDDEQCHHGGHEIGIGDFPRAAVMAAVLAFPLDYDNGLWRFHLPLLSRCRGFSGSRCWLALGWGSRRTAATTGLLNL
jgi:hypothetical protein